MALQIQLSHIINYLSIRSYTSNLILEMKKYKTLWIAGASICLAGEIIRKVAILTAKKSFHHIVSKGFYGTSNKTKRVLSF